MHHERAREADALAHAAGELARIRRLEAVEADEVDRLQRALADLRVRQPEGLEAELHVLEHREPGKEREALKHHGDAARGTRDGCALVVHHPAGRRIQARDQPQQRRLAGARAAEQADDLPGPQCQVDVLEHDELVAVGLAEGLADAPHVEQRSEVERELVGIHWPVS